MSIVQRIFPIEPLPIHHSWPLDDQPRRFELGLILNCGVTDIIEPMEVGELGVHHAGCWDCELADDTLGWSGGVYDIFGLPRGVEVTRKQAVGFYAEHSRAVMERIGMSRNEDGDFSHPRLTPDHPLSRHVLYAIDRPA